MCEGLAIRFGFEWFSDPAFAFLSATVEFLQTVYEPDLLLFEHLDITVSLLARLRYSSVRGDVPLGIDLVMSFLALTKDANGVVCATPAARASAITL